MIKEDSFLLVPNDKLGFGLNLQKILNHLLKLFHRRNGIALVIACLQRPIMMHSFNLSPIYITFIITIIIITSPSKLVSSLGIGSTISISYGSNAICGILAGESQSIACYIDGQILPVSSPNVSYDSISGGKDFFCGLTSGGFSLHCWDTGNSNETFQAKVIYENATAPLTSLSVGELHFCALLTATGMVQCWAKNTNTAGSPPFTLPKQSTRFISTTSGEGFSCGIVKNSGFVSCWGEAGTSELIQNAFGNTTMLSLVAGKSHACGLTMGGVLVCKGSDTTGHLDVPLNKAFQFSSVALGVNHTCAIQTKDGSVVCWGGNDATSDFMDIVVASFSFESITAGLDFTCGLETDLTVICWGPGWPTSFAFSMSEIPLPNVVPGPCVKDPCGACGAYPNSTSLCGGVKDTSICRSCEIPRPPPPVPDDMASPAPQPLPVSQSLKTSSSTAASSAKEASTNKVYLSLEIIGSVLCLAALISSVFVIRKKLTDKDEKLSRNSTGSNVTLNRTRDSVLEGSYPASALNSRSSSLNYDRRSSIALQLKPTRSMSVRPGNKAENFSFTVLAAATENFSTDNIVGSGSFGTVYRGRLADGRPVAIKREETMMKSSSTDDDDDSDLDLDLEILSRLHHKHLVGLLGFCKEKEEILLIFEFMANGALHDHLHTKKGDTTLNSWRTRVKIALDAARGVEYLHNYAVPPIIHQDIKSSNILIDSNWIARVSDFGLSTFSTDNSAAQSGYVDPEYNVSKVLTTKSDVYGFGVVLLELLTGKKAVFMNSEGMEPMSLAEYTQSYIQGGEVWKVLDKRIGYPLLHEAEAVELVASTALRCVSLDGKERPAMSEVVANLEKAYILCKENDVGDA